MTPKDKANELFYKFSKHFVDSNADYVQEPSKVCALIVVDEILKADPMKPDEEENFIDESLQYWKKVKKEIEKL